MTRKKIRESVKKGDSARLDSLHSHKDGTPTMGGVIILFSLVVSTLLFADWNERLVWFLLVLTLAFAGIGLIDDLSKLRSGKKGISARAKFSLQIIGGSCAAAYLFAFPLEAVNSGVAGAGSALYVPIVQELLPIGAVLFSVFVVLVFVSLSNAVNLTDGLDGLAAGCSTLCSSTLLIFALAAASMGWSESLGVPAIVGSSEVAIFAAALSGAGLGFLWFNCHPARIFMGDTGSLSIGAAVAGIAVVLKQEILLGVVSGVLLSEAASVVIQVASFKTRGKRVFLIAPLHHHFQFKGWKETQVTVRFWIAGAVCSLMTIGILSFS
ncbi:MAG: phospho-N-acetylmuramoyl-pentapeptide-transferase [Planctomycetota bacterium]